MTSYQSLSDYVLPSTPQAAPAPVPAPSTDLSTSKKLAVAAATDEKKAALGGKAAPLDPYQVATGALTGRGSESMSQMESDLRTMDPFAFKFKYGEAGQRFQDEVTTAAGQVFRDSTNQRSVTEAARDSVIGIPTTAVSQIAGIANWGIGALDADLGAAVTRNINASVADAKSYQSDPLKAAERLNQARTSLSSRDNNALREQDIKSGDSKLVADLKSFGRGIVSGTEDLIASPTTTLQAGTDAVGSLLAGGALTKGLKVAGEAASLGKLSGPGVKLAAEMDRGLGSMSLARAADATARGAEWAAWPTATALLEGGGAFQGTVTDVLNTPIAELEQTSQSFRDSKAGFLSQGKSEEEAGILARNQVARSAGLDAAAIQAPAAAVTSLIARGSGEHPLHKTNITGALREMGQEAIEEFTQSGSGQLAQNIGIQNNVNPNQSLSEDVGAQAVQGAAAGALSVATSQGPRAAVTSTVDGAKAVANAGIQGVANLAGGLINRGKQAIQQDSPVSDQRVQEETTALVAQAPQVEAEVHQAIDAIDTPAATPEAKTQAKDYVSSLVQALGFDASSEKMDHLPQPLQEALAKAPNRSMAILEAATAVDDATDPKSQSQAALALYELMEPIARLQDANPGALDELPPDHPIRKEFQKYQQIIEMVGQSPTIVSALTKALSLADSGKLDEQIPAVTTESLNTPEGVQAIQSTVTAANISPTAIAPEKIEAILKHADDGLVTLTPSQKAILQTSLDAINAHKAYLDQVKANGLTQTKDIVSSQIFSANDPLRARDDQPASAIQHMTRIRQAVQSGNTAKAQSYLQDLGKFVQHMKNKVQAINDHFALNDPHAPALPYMALMPGTREFKLSSANGSAKHKGMFANTKSERSIDLNQSIEAEQTALAGIYNSLVQAFPELGEQEIEPLSLPDALHGKPADVLKAFAGNQQKNTPTPVKAEAAAATETVTAPQVPETTTKAAAESQTQEDTKKEIKEESKLASKEESKTEAAPQTNTEVKPAAKTETVVQEEAAPAPTGTKALFPNLIRRSENMLDRAFKLIQGEQAPNRIISQEQSPVSLIQAALKNSSTFTALLLSMASSSEDDQTSKGALRAQKLTPDVAARYQDLLSDDLKGILKAMNASLAKFLSDPSIKAKLRDGQPVNRWSDGKALNILDEADGKLKYNEFLQQAAALAGIQWVLTANNFQKELSLEDLSDVTGLDEDAVQSLSPDEIQNLSQGVSLDDAIGNLSTLITQFWGLKSDAASDLAYAQGIPQAVAAEVLQALIAQGLVTKPPSVRLGREHGLAEERTIDRYVVEALDEKDPLKGYPTAIQDAVLVDPTEVVFLGETLPPVAQRQMNNPDVANTAEQKQALENEQKTPFYINETMLNVYAALGVDGMVKLFGAGDTSKRVLNETHAKTLEGQNRMVLSSLGSLSSLLDQIQKEASARGITAAEVAVRYAYNFSRVGRMQMLGSYNPQASKLVREAVLPTWSTLDLSERGSEASKSFFLGMAQALDIKVHKKGIEASVTEVQALLANALAPAIEMLADLDPANPELDAGKLQEVFKTAKVPVTAIALHALSEYARYTQAGPKELTAFRTGLYVEADGVTNGPINAMVLMSIGKFTPQWVTNVAKGGLSFGSPKTMHALNQLPGGDVDLYGASALATGERLKTLNGVLRNQGHGLTEQAGQLYGMMSLLGMKGVDYDPNRPEGEQLKIDRNIAKNPLTITIYGSSAPGIANKLVGMLTDEVHARMSIAAEAMSKDSKLSLEEALFPGEPEKGRQLAQMINDLTTQKVTFNKLKNEYSLVSVPTTDRDADPVKFRFDKLELDALRANMLNLLVNPMRDGITEVVGEPLMKAVLQLRQATQAQSIVLEQLYKQGIEDAIAERQKSDPDFRKGDFLSKADLAKVLKKLKGISPLVQAAGQVFMITKSKKIERDKHSFARALDGTMRTTAQVYAPTNAGVAGIPFTTIGFGDGVMMLNLALDSSIQGTLKIFDGMNMPLDKLGDYSRKANKAVSQSWANNPLRAVAETYAKFIENKDEIAAALDREAAEIKDPSQRLFNQALVRALFEDAKKGQVMPTQVLIDQLVRFQKNLDWAASSAEARHKAMTDVAMSVDQMAAAGAPYANSPAGANLAEMTTDQTVELLEERYQFHLTNQTAPAAVQAPAPVAAPVTTATTKPVDKPAAKKAETVAPVLDLEKIGRTDKVSGVRVIGFTALKKLARKSGFSDAQKLILGEILRSLGTKEYTVVSGSAAQIAAYQKARGLTGLNDPQTGDSRVHGYVSIGEKTIYLIDPTPETLVHELVHAATYEIVAAHYQGRTQGEDAQVVSDAVQRLETMMNDFLGMVVDPVTTPIEVQEAIERARSAIENAQSPAEALNEFMAWGLTNQALTTKLKDTKGKSWVLLAKDVVKAIKSLIWGRKKAPAVADDVLSNLQFNAGILVRSQLKLSSLVQQATLFHQSNGMSDRLVRLRDALDAKVIALLNGAPNRTLALQAELSDVIDLTADVSDAFAAEFTMDAGAQSTFEMVVKALAMRTEVDPQGMARLQELYTHVIKTLTPTSFVPENPVDLPSEEYYSAQKYNLILGKTVRRTDPQGRSTLLPAFLGLALVSDEFRQVLAKMDLPKTAKNAAGTVDASLENVGTEWMDWLSRTLSGEGKSRNVAQAIDRLADQITKSALAEQNLISEIGSKAQGTSETVNRAMANGLDTLADKTILLNQKLQQGASSKGIKALGSVAETLTRMASEKNGEAVSVGIMDAASRVKLWKPVFSLINEAVGRTLENGPVYDMIKQVRAVAQQLRQEFRDTVPRVIAAKFSRTLTSQEWSALYTGLGKTDLAVLMDGSNLKDTLGVLTGNKALTAQIKDLEDQIQQSNPSSWSLYQDKMNQLASFMVTGKTKGNLLRNVHAISRLLGMDKPKGWKLPNDAVTKQMDKLVTLYAIKEMSQADRDTVASLVQAEGEGVGFALNYLVGQRNAEMAKALQGKALFNHYKGHLPAETRKGVSLRVADDRKAAKLREQGYVRVGNYRGSLTDTRRGSMGYYYAPINGRAAFTQGTFQNIKQTASGVDQSTGYTSGLVAGRILDRFKVATYARYMNGEAQSSEALLPIYSDVGQVIAFERAVDPVQLQRIKPSSNLADMIGVWRGRQLEEGFAQTTNETLVDRLYDMWRNDIKAGSRNQEKYINLFDAGNDAVIRDAVSLFSDETLEHIRDKFGNEFWVRRDQVDNAIGYRMASVRDLFDAEKSPLSKTAQDNLKRAMVGMTSPDVFRYLVQGEQAVQGFIHSMRENIVIRSMIVPAYNAASNVVQLAMKGVPWDAIGKGTGTKLSEIHSYTQTRLRQVELEAELRAAGTDLILQRRLQTEIQSIEDSHKRLSIWPLIEAGEFSTVADVGMTAEDLEITSGNLAGFVRKQIEKLPPKLQTAARYGLVSRDTALFAGLQKAVQYGDFVAKAILYDDLVKRRKLSSKDALTRVTEAFVNYDFLPGRERNYLESIGLLWFFNYKIRIAKQALIMMRENPLQALIGTALPLPDGVGTTLEDNIFTKLAEGSLPYSMGPNMAFRGLHMNPWYNLVF